MGKFGPKSRTFTTWSYRFRHTDPLPVQIAAMDQRSALRLLRVILGGKFIRRGYELKERTSRWIWALLARLPDRGEMDYEDIGWVRELGKRAVLMMISISHVAALQALQDDTEDGLEGEDVEEDDHVLCDTEVDMDQVDVPDPVETEEPTALQCEAVDQLTANNEVDVDDQEVDMDLDDGEVTDDSSSAGNIQADIAAAKARLLAQLEDVAEAPSADAEAEGVIAATRTHANMRVTLNLILTVAGEFYGQTDLLEFRDPFSPI